MIRDAIRRQASFNVLHLETMIKVDVFLAKSGPYDSVILTRVVIAPPPTRDGWSWRRRGT